MTISEAQNHAGDLTQFDEDIVGGVMRCMPRYLWIIDNYTGDDGWPDEEMERVPHRLLHCEVCGRENVEASRWGHYRVSYPQNDGVVCPFCGEISTVKHVSKGIKSMHDRLNVVFYRKSATDRDVVVAMAARCERLFEQADTREPWALEPDIDVRGIAVFDAARRESMRLQTRMIYDHGWPVGIDWKQVKAMTGLTFGEGALFPYQRPETVLLERTMESAIRDTPIERALDWSYVDGTDGIKAMDLITRYPCVEYLTKLGLEEFVTNKLNGTLPPRLLNWRGKDMPGVLRLSRERLGQLKGKKIPLTPELCDVLHYIDRQGIRCGIETADGVAHACRDEREPAGALARALLYLPAEKRSKALKYIARNRLFKVGHVRDIADYWRISRELGNSLADDAEAFPKDFRAAHDRATARVKVARNRDKDVAIVCQLKKLDKRFGFAFGGLILRPAASAEEVIREGEELHHCVGTYVDKYASGQTVICVLRRAVDPDRPWRTVEISPKTGKLIQDRGLHNDWGNYTMPDNLRAALDLFWEAWRERNKRQRERKTA